MVKARVLAAWLRETDRPPLPPGDARSWSVLTTGTLLEGAPWPGWNSGWSSSRSELAGGLS